LYDELEKVVKRNSYDSEDDAFQWARRRAGEALMSDSEDIVEEHSAADAKAHFTRWPSDGGIANTAETC